MLCSLEWKTKESLGEKFLFFSNTAHASSCLLPPSTCNDCILPHKCHTGPLMCLSRMAQPLRPWAWPLAQRRGLAPNLSPQCPQVKAGLGHSCSHTVRSCSGPRGSGPSQQDWGKPCCSPASSCLEGCRGHTGSAQEVCPRRDRR